MKKLIALLLACVTADASTVHTEGLITAFGTQPSGTLIFYPTAGTFGTNVMTTLSQSVPFANGAFTNVTLSGGNYEVDYYNRMLLNIFVPFGDTNNWQLTDLATNLTSYVTFGQLSTFSNNVYSAAVAAGTAAAIAQEVTISNVLQTQITASLTNFVVSNITFAASTFYTNTTGKRSYISIEEQLAANTGNTPVALMYIGNTANSWSFTNAAILNSSASVVGVNLQLSGMVGPGQVFCFSNFAGGGTSVVVVTNGSFWVSF